MGSVAFVSRTPHSSSEEFSGITKVHGVQRWLKTDPMVDLKACRIDAHPLGLPSRVRRHLLHRCCLRAQDCDLGIKCHETDRRPKCS